jgi:hypothetical protein
MNHFVELCSQGWKALGDDLPDGVVFETETGMSQNVTEASDSPPGHLPMPLSNLTAAVAEHLAAALPPVLW